MHLFFKKFLALIALLSILSSSAWAVSPALMADDVFTAEHIEMLDEHLQRDVHLQLGVHLQKKTQENPLQHPESTCNHACHFSAHVLGLVSSGIAHVMPTLESGTYTFPIPPQVNHPILQGLYRPPILS